MQMLAEKSRIMYVKVTLSTFLHSISFVQFALPSCNTQHCILLSFQYFGPSICFSFSAQSWAMDKCLLLWKDSWKLRLSSFKSHAVTLKYLKQLNLQLLMFLLLRPNCVEVSLAGIVILFFFYYRFCRLWVPKPTGPAQPHSALLASPVQKSLWINGLNSFLNW